MMRLPSSPFRRTRLPADLQRLGPWSGRSRSEQVGNIELERLGDRVQRHQGGRWRLTTFEARESPDAYACGVGKALLGDFRLVTEIPQVLAEALEEDAVSQRAKQAAAGVSFPGIGLPELDCSDPRVRAGTVGVNGVSNA